jgi:hyperosmotically inducible protein
MFRVAVFAALLPGAMFAQSSSQQKDKPKLETRKPNTISPQAQARIEREVRHELLGVPQFGVFDHMAFKVEGSKVTLMGSVTKPVISQNAERAVKSIEGVDQVDNKIEVLPVITADDQIRLATFRAIYGQPSLQRYAIQAVPPIHIIVNRGHVTLEGAVLNKSDSQIAETQARTVSGVFSVTNNLRIDQEQSADRTK